MSQFHKKVEDVNSLGVNKRLRKRAEYLKIQSKGKKNRSKYLLISIVENKSEFSRIGVTITKKIDKRAARRNRLRRRIKEVFRKFNSKFEFSADIVVVGLKDSTDINFSQVKKDLVYLFYQSSLLKPLRQKRL